MRGNADRGGTSRIARRKRNIDTGKNAKHWITCSAASALRGCTRHSRRKEAKTVPGRRHGIHRAAETNLIVTQSTLYGDVQGRSIPAFYVTIETPWLWPCNSATEWSSRDISRMNPFYDRMFIEDSYACRIVKTTRRQTGCNIGCGRSPSNYLKQASANTSTSGTDIMDILKTHRTRLLLLDCIVNSEIRPSDCHPEWHQCPDDCG